MKLVITLAALCLAVGCGRSGPQGVPGATGQDGAPGAVGPQGPQGAPGAPAVDPVVGTTSTVVLNHALSGRGLSVQRTTIILQNTSSGLFCRFRIRNRDLKVFDEVASFSGCGFGSQPVILGVGQEIYLSVPFSGTGNCVLSIDRGTATCSASTPQINL